MPLKKRTTTTTTIAPMTNAAIKQLITQGVADSLAKIEENKTSRNGDDSHDSGTGSRKTERAARECNYSDFLKFKPLNFKGTKGVCADVVEFTREIKKLEIELWNLKVKELDEVEKYVGGLPDMIQGSVMASKPKTMQDTIEFATELMDHKIRSLANNQAKNKRKLDDSSRNNQNQQQPLKGIIWQGSILLSLGKRKCTGDLNLCALNETTITIGNVLPSAQILRGLAIWPKTVKASLLLPTTREPYGQIKRFSLDLRNGGATARAYAVGNAGKNPDANVVMGTFLLNNNYASILFDTGADRSFVSTAFSSLIDIIPTAFDHDYDVELVDGQIN
ncbi:putative reverse transcriptase domain-containing protein [Tanacetum coccineum]